MEIGQLEQAAKDIGLVRFLGILAPWQLRKGGRWIPHRCSYIIFTKLDGTPEHDSSTDGHFLVVTGCDGEEGPIVFDSLGELTSELSPTLYEMIIRLRARRIIKTQLQSLESETCALWCLAFLVSVERGRFSSAWFENALSDDNISEFLKDEICLFKATRMERRDVKKKWQREAGSII